MIEKYRESKGTMSFMDVLEKDTIYAGTGKGEQPREPTKSELEYVNY